MLRELVARKGEKLKETPDLTINKIKYKAELIPPALIVQRYFAAQQTKLDALQTKLDNATQELADFIEEHSVEDGSLAEALNDKDKVTKASVTARLKRATESEEYAALTQAQRLFDAETRHKKAVKDARDVLDLAVFKHYPSLSEADIKVLIVDDKWLATLRGQIEAEIERITQQLANRIRELDERYAESMPAITQSIEQLNNKVVEHLKTMGLTL
jgi:type I restriction enzyme M protein